MVSGECILYYYVESSTIRRVAVCGFGPAATPDHCDLDRHGRLFG